MEEKKIILLLSQPLDQRNYNRFGIVYWRNAGWDVEIWDMTPLLFPKVWAYNVSNGVVSVADSANRIIKSKEDIPEVRYANGMCLFVDLINNTEPEYLKVKQALFKAGWSCLLLKLASLPEPQPTLEVKAKKLLFTQLGRIKNLRKYFFAKNKNAEFKKYIDRTYVAVSGYRTYQNALSLTSSENIIKVHSFDYDQYISAESKSLQSGIAVFLDEDMPYHSDFIYNNIPSVVSAELYFQSIKHFFSVIEKQMRVKCVIAAHPRSNYNGDRSWCYRSYQIEKNNTSLLIQQADVVIAHSSASIQLAVIYDKPVILITTDEIMQTSYHKYIEEFSKELGCSIINVDKVKKSDKITIEEIDHKKYAQYKYSHITMLKQNTERLWDIIIRELQIKLESNLSVTKKLANRL